MHGFIFVIHANQTKLLKIIFSAGVVLIITYNAVIQFPIATAYARAVDERLAFIEEQRTVFKGDILELMSLPPSGMLHSGEVSEDTRIGTTAI